MLLNYAIKAISNWISVPSQKRDDNLDLFEFVNHIFSFVDSPEQSQKNVEIIHLLSSFIVE